MQRRTVIITLLIALAVLGIGAAFIAITRSRSQTEWDKLRAMLAAKGYEMDWRKLIPAEAPDAQNYFEHPVVKELIPAKAASAPKAASTSGVRPPSKIPGVELPLRMDWLLTLPIEGTSPSNSLARLEAWFAQWDHTVVGLRDAAKRPHARLDGDYTDPASMPVPDAPAVRAHAQFIVSRAQAHLVLKNPAEALADLDALEALMRAMNTRPTVTINTSIYIALVSMYVQTVRDGLNHSLWQKAQLEQLITRLRSFNTLEATAQALREGELAGVGGFISNHGKEPPRKPNEKRRFSLARMGSRFQPRVWIRENQAHHARVIDGFIEPLDPVKGRLYLAKLSHGKAALTNLSKARGMGAMLAQYSIPNVIKITERAAESQNLLHHATIACALELQRLNQGKLPTTLDALVPAILKAIPPDVVGGGSPVYEASSTSFTLYSVGMDGGNNSGDDSLDFVWSLKESAAAAKN